MADDNEEASPRDKAIQAMLDYEILSPKELAEYQVRGILWQSDPAQFEDWGLSRLYIYIQILDKLATNPPPGRSQAQIVVQAIKDVRELFHALADVMQEARTGKKKGDKK